ncbi:diiron oxygenase [Variovorax sp. PBL-H6]|uniref:diiron oxygenase n=1 Tax=Variovorax sp. PBL-H6 TaxID=434009 RepID=UPI0013A5B1CF|nr:diiron oxygenase [Variovorax sp. PBL-H6]
MSDDMNYFSPHLVRLNAHPLVFGKGEPVIKALQRRHLYRYLAATEAIEIEMVNPALQFVMSSNIAPEFVLDAYKVYTDEGFHALMCMDLRNNISNGEMPYLLRYRSSALDRTLALVKTGTEPDAQLILLAIACVNETMIASSLSQATDYTVFAALRELVMAHARDEAAHNIYFTELMVDFFPRLSAREQRLLIDLMPDIFNSLHLSDKTGAENDLRAQGFSESEIQIILGETFNGEVDHEGVRRVCRSSLRMLSRCGLLDIPQAQEAFAEKGLAYLFQ